MGIREYDYITYNDFLDSTKHIDEKVEYSCGQIFYMSPTHPSHNKIQNKIYSILDGILNSCGMCDVYTSDIAVKFSENDDIHHQFEPDVLVVCDDNFKGAIYNGIPYLIVEVLSTATKDRDTGIKLDVYEKHGVNEYWIVDVTLMSIKIYSDNVNGKYKSCKTYENGDYIDFKNSKISVDEIFKAIKLKRL
ncbi:MAG: Uma2 family endonuclease [Clostridium sp.]